MHLPKQPLTVLARISWGQQFSRKLLHTRGSSNLTRYLSLSPTFNEKLWRKNKNVSTSLNKTQATVREVYIHVAVTPMESLLETDLASSLLNYHELYKRLTSSYFNQSIFLTSLVAPGNENCPKILILTACDSFY